MKYQWINSGYQKLQISFLYLKHLIKVCSVQLIKFEESSVLSHNQWRTVLTWQVKGCHRIKIGEHTTLPGSIKGLSIKSEAQDRLITITFLGVFDRIIHRVQVRAETVSMVHPFSATVTPFDCPPVQFNIEPRKALITSQLLKVETLPFSIQVDIQPSVMAYLNICPINHTNQ